MSVQLLFPNTSEAVFWLLSPGCAPQQSDPTRPVRSPFPEHICRASTVLGMSPAAGTAEPPPRVQRGGGGGASRSALTAGRHRKSEGPGGKAGKEVVKSA